MHNPFFHRQGITDPRHFHGRAELVRGLLEMVAYGQSCALVGERRIGKTSLLAYLAAPPVLASHGVDPARTFTVSLDFLALQSYSPEELWREILELLEPQVSDEPARRLIQETASAEAVAFPALRRVMRTLHRQGARIVLLCDEFELAVQNPQFDEGFFGALRSLAGNEGVVYLTASRLSLLELEQYHGDAARAKVLGSSFFNIFAEFNVGPFEDWEMADLLAACLDPTPVRFDEADVAFLDRIAGRHPFFLQLACYHLFALLVRAGAHVEGRRPGDLHHEVRERIQREAAKIFRTLWQNSKRPERTALAALAVADTGREAGTFVAGGLTGVSYRTLSRLEQRALVRVGDRSAAPHRRSGPEMIRSYRLFSEALAEWILANVTATLAGLLTQEELDSRRAPETRARRPEEIPAPERYTLLEEIGRGGAGTVFKAWDERLERVVALKVLDREMLSSPQHLERLLQEARTCAGLHHPHIVVVHDIDVEQGYLVTEFLAGGSLRDLLEAMPTLPEDDVLALAEQLADALAAAHAAGVVHRDLKPENVLLVQRPAVWSKPAEGPVLPPVKLADFGTALRLAEGAHSRERRAVAGTLRYMSPEQLAGEEVGPLTDLYTLGVVLYEALHGRRPSVAAAGRELEAGSPPIEQVIARCLELLPRDRYADAGELLQAVRGITGSSSAAASGRPG